jgi:molybdopterin converting factor subunit 1
MTIHVRLFAILRDQAGVSELNLQLLPDSHITDAASQITERFPALAKYLSRSAYAVNQNYVSAQTLLHDGDELAFIPPVSGGTDDDWIDIVNTPIDCAAAMSFAVDSRIGGINVFLGTTRAETDAMGRKLVALDYEAYREMAIKQLRNMATHARKTWLIVRLVLLHRVGRVGISEPSVMIVVAAPHRAEAFEACRWLIDTLKKEAAIWKKEIWEDSGESWSSER